MIVFVLAGCLDGPDCVVTASNLVKIDFKNANGTARSVRFTRVSISGTTASFFVNSDVASVALPLDPTKTEATITFLEGTIAKRVTLTYAVVPRIISEKCGAFSYYTILTVKENAYTSARIRNANLLTAISTNVEIFY